MDTIQLGNTDLRVSDRCLGTMFFGTKVPAEMAYNLMDLYCAQGGNFLDTANVYYAFLPGTKGGESEETIGAWIRQRKNREKLILASKVGVAYGDIEAGLKPQRIVEECNKSLTRLGVDCIDLYYLHSDDRNTPLEDILGACRDLIKAGKIRYLGASNFFAWRLQMASGVLRSLDMSEFACNQCWYTYLRPNPGTLPIPGRVFISEDLADYCKMKNITVLGYETLLRGTYNDDAKAFRDNFRSFDNQKRLEQVRLLAKEKNVSPAAVVYAWMLNQHPRPIPIITASKAEHLLENISSGESILSAEDVKRLDKAICS